MGGEQGGRASRQMEPRPASEWLAESAYSMSSALPLSAEEWKDGMPRVPVISDTYALYRMANLEAEVAELCLESEMPSTQCRLVRQELNTGLAIYREALPFSEAERRWISGVCSEVYLYSKAERVIRSKEAEIMTAGLRRVVRGDDLFRRWWSWRRQTDEFTDQGGLHVARSGLESVARLLMPKPLPTTLTEGSHLGTERAAD